MEIVTIILAADDDEYSAVGESDSPLEQWSGIEAPRLDTLKVALLHCLLSDDSLQTALDAYEPVFVAENENIVLRIADKVLDKLVSFDEKALESVAYELAATEVFEREGWETGDVFEQLSSLTELAQLADSQGQVLFVWMHPVQH